MMQYLQVSGIIVDRWWLGDARQARFLISQGIDQ